MRYLIIICFNCLSLVSCNSAGNKNSIKINTSKIESNKTMVINTVDPDYSYLFRSMKLPKEFDYSDSNSVKDIAYITTGLFGDGFNINEIVKIDALGRYQIVNLGDCFIFHGTLNRTNLPEIYPTSFYLFISPKLEICQLAWIDKIYFLDLFNNFEYTPAGVLINYRNGNGYFLIFEFPTNALSKVNMLFDSGLKTENDYLIPYLNDQQCYKYSNDTLAFRFIDYNNDGYSDLNFNGIIERFCHNENRKDRWLKDRSVEREEIDLTFYCNVVDGKYNWITNDTLQLSRAHKVKSNW